MNTYRTALCWAAAILGVAVAWMLDVLDEQAARSLVIGLVVVSPMMARGRSPGHSWTGTRA